MATPPPPTCIILPWPLPPPPTCIILPWPLLLPLPVSFSHGHSSSPYLYHSPIATPSSPYLYHSPMATPPPPTCIILPLPLPPPPTYIILPWPLPPPPTYIILPWPLLLPLPISFSHGHSSSPLPSHSPTFTSDLHPHSTNRGHTLSSLHNAARTDEGSLVASPSLLLTAYYPRE